MDLATTTAAGLNAGTLIAAGSLAVAFAALVGAYARRATDSRRADDRARDAVEGYKDRNGAWHLGVIDQVQGYYDTDGDRHDGLVDRVGDNEVKIARLQEQAHTHPGGRR